MKKQIKTLLSKAGRHAPDPHTPAKTGLREIGGLGADKIAYLPARQLRAHPSHTAQRPLVLRRAMEIVRDFNPSAVTQIQAAECAIKGDRGIWTLDGQTRCAGVVGHDLLLLGMGEKDVARTLLEHAENLEHEYPTGVGNALVECGIHTAVKTESEAARLFLAFNSATKVNTFSTYENRVLAGYLRESRIEQILNQHGLRSARYKAKTTVACVGTLQHAFDLDKSGNALSEAIAAIVSAWGQNVNAYEAAIVKGVALFCHKHKTDPGRLTRTLRKRKPEDLTSEAFTLHRGHAVPSPAHGVLLRIENKYK